MKIKKVSFLLLTSVTCFASLDAFACAKGQYKVGALCYGCPNGCYCPKADQDWSGCGAVTCDAANKTTLTRATCKDAASGTYGVFLCPKNFPLSNRSGSLNGSGASDISGCYTIGANGTPLYYKKISECKAGTYLPQMADSCKKCEPDKVCPGIKNVYISLDKDQGIQSCSSGLVPNKNNTECEKPDTTITIDARTYLPANSSAPAACLAGYFCPGAKVEKVQPFEQGIEQCPENTISKAAQAKCDLCPKGTKANEDHTACTDADITVPSGYYLKANSVEPRPCTAPKTYCPGGTFSKSGKDQGVYNCPYESKSNSSHTGCDLYLTKEQMQNGIYGKKGDIVSQCWLKTDVNDYKTCVLGGKFQD